MPTIPQVVCGVFYAPPFFAKAELEFKWSIQQNEEFWRSAVLYADIESAERLHRHFPHFREVVVDQLLPEHVSRQRRWNCKGWWAKKAVDRFGRVLYCDFDIYVRRPIDHDLAARLVRSPMFLDMPTYRSPHKIVGCGCVYYDERSNWDSFFDFLYGKWGDDERAWTDALEMTQAKLRAEGWHMSPYIVDQSWLRLNPERCHEPYIIHGISPCDGGRAVLCRLGYRDDEIHFHRVRSHEIRQRMVGLREHLGRLKRRLLGAVNGVNSRADRPR